MVEPWWSGTRTSGSTPYAEAALIIRAVMDRSSGECSRSMTTKSNPALAMMSTLSTVASLIHVPRRGVRAIAVSKKLMLSRP